MSNNPLKLVVWRSIVAASRATASLLARRGLNTQQILEVLWPLRAALQRLRCRGVVVHASGARFLYQSDDLINLKLALVGAHEFETTHFFQTFLQPTDVFVDVGANLGYFSVLAALKLTEGQVVAIEPSPRTCAALQSNAALNELTNLRIVQSVNGGREPRNSDVSLLN